jgi:hypothetical protein
LRGDAMRLGGGGDGFFALGQPAGQRLLAERGVGDFLQGLGHRAVVVGDRLVVARDRAAQFAAQAATGEDRQRDGRADAAGRRTAL